MEIQPLLYTNIALDCVNNIYKHLIRLKSINGYLKSEVINYNNIIYILNKINELKEYNHLKHFNTFIIKVHLKIIKFLRNKISSCEYYYLLYFNSIEYQKMSHIKVILLRYSKFFNFKEMFYGLSTLKVIFSKKECLEIL